MQVLKFPVLYFHNYIPYSQPLSEVQEELKILICFLRTFHLVLHPINEETGPFNVDHFLDVDGGFVDIEPKSFLYEGYVKGRLWENLFADLF